MMFDGDNSFVFRFSHFNQKCLYLYEQERDYLTEKNNYLELITLIKFDKIVFNQISEDEYRIKLINDANIKNIIFDIS